MRIFKELRKYLICRNEKCAGKMNFAYCRKSQKVELCKFKPKQKKVKK